MKTVIKDGETGAEAKKKIQTLHQARKKGDISKHFGKLKRGLDGLTYQKGMRDETE